jgi:hypothetical protein
LPVTTVCSATRARPKSDSLAVPRASSSTLEGLGGDNAQENVRTCHSN